MRATWIRNCTLIGALALTACTHSDLRPDYVRQPSAAIPAQADDPLAAYAKRLTTGHGSDSVPRTVRRNPRSPSSSTR